MQRELGIKFTEAKESITRYFKEERDPLFLRGEAIGEARSRMEIGAAMKKDGIPVEQIAKFTNLSIEEIEKL